ncbi:NAD(P)H-dependent glycerol-3-phosphate dehydrogenase [Nitrococcus mobilis]|uniref:Glycerol-3-phosphate dehydrogenase [NAD(P)+] n=1 Tax=Nitrococcus mobilis Nb-231 TaxID=314278 RepID=A4BTY1_9GAMM|nr:NAD(P)H-dependent glycerol-3-phosphate dehydrogenase [Nitrococcus mobilis]EAR20802.1 NAD(P)H-dependent glycerol-3-phosphate dehydrogenase [Nitrococcus mobilis Nb-231]
MQYSDTISVVGAGSWGTALALVLARNGYRVYLWSHDPDHVERMSRERANLRYLPDAPFPAELRPVAELEIALRDVQEVLVVVPSAVFSRVLEQMAPLLAKHARVTWATKGLDADTGNPLHCTAERLLPGRALAVLSGPSFAREVAKGLPTAVTVASRNVAFAHELADAFHNESFRVYTSDDMLGVELGGAVKNVLAIATGIADGLGMGANARAGLITRGLAELRRLGRAMQARSETFMGLSGMGDLILTCTDDQSRNRRMGLALGQGIPAAQALQQIGQTVEGLQTTADVHRLARRMGVEMPICEQVHLVLSQHLSAKAAAANLMLRKRKSELD